HRSRAEQDHQGHDRAVPSDLICVYIIQSQNTSASTMIAIPADTYVISASVSVADLSAIDSVIDTVDIAETGLDMDTREQIGSTTEQIVALQSFAIDLTEVTNVAYRACVDAGACPLPRESGNSLGDTYFNDPAFDQYPVTYVGWDAANTYCTWMGKRLPTTAEWEVAASHAPATNRRYRYPWGDWFEPSRANNVVSGTDGPRIVGYYQPAGNSPFGVVDMAGNVAEWTAVAQSSMESVQREKQVVHSAVVKGGSYQDNRMLLRTDSQRILPKSTTEAWLGFRCAISQVVHIKR
ncbi:MAG: formylglycine-generating enzyme family protein, partial [Chloroflexota bacterium]